MSAQSQSPVNEKLNPFPLIQFPQFRETGFRVTLLTDSPGVIEVPALRNTVVSIHIGPSIWASCRRDGNSHCGTVVHGDIEIMPAGIPSVWEIKEKDTALVMSISPDLMTRVAEEFDLDPARIEIRNCFQMRDPQLENIGWALKAEMEAGYPSGKVYLESLAVSVTARLLRCYSSRAIEQVRQNGRLSDRRLRQVVSYIEENLSRNISLGDLAAVAGVSVSHFKSLFRQSMGLSAHQYVIRRRVERAKSLLGEGKMPISQIAFETGFAHQSHLARHMRRVLGLSPKTLRQMLR